MSNKKEKTIEIPESVARAYLEKSGDVIIGSESLSKLRQAIKDAIPKSREERLGLPWHRHPRGLLTDCDLKVIVRTTATEDQAKLIACAPEMAELLEKLAGGQSVTRAAQDLLRRAGWSNE